MTEAELERIASRLGTGAVQHLEGERLAEAVLARLAAEPVPVTPVRRLRRGILVGLAAAAGLLLVLRLAVRPDPAPAEGAASATTALTVLHELDDLSVSELETLLETLPPSATEPEHPDAASFEELDAKSLERLLRSLEG